MKTISPTSIRRQTLGTLTLVTTLVSFAATARGDVNVYQNTLQSTTWVLAKSSEGTASSAGVLIDQEKRLVITNAHVVGDSRNTVVFFPSMKEGRAIAERSHYLQNVSELGIRGRVVSVDRRRDLALIQLNKLPESARAIEMVTESATPGAIVKSIGNAGTTDALWVHTSGEVRQVYQKQFRTGFAEHDFKVLETDAPINSGDSGGPVVNSDGKLVAISQATSIKGTLVTYCVDITEIHAFLGGPWKEAPLSVESLLEKADLTYTKHETGHYQVQLGEDDAKETVFVTNDVEYFEKADVRKIWALAQITKEQPTQETMFRLLQQSARTKLGAWTVEQDAEGQFMIIYCVKLDATATPEAMKSTMEYVAKLTTAMKKELTPKTVSENATETLSKWLSD